MGPAVFTAFERSCFSCPCCGSFWTAPRDRETWLCRSFHAVFPVEVSQETLAPGILFRLSGYRIDKANSHEEYLLTPYFPSPASSRNPMSTE